MRLDVAAHPGDVASSSRRLLASAGRMTLTQERKQELISKFGDSPTDTGKAEVQIALMTERINELNEHLRTTARTTTRDVGC